MGTKVIGFSRQRKTVILTTMIALMATILMLTTLLGMVEAQADTATLSLSVSEAEPGDTITVEASDFRVGTEASFIYTSTITVGGMPIASVASVDPASGFLHAGRTTDSGLYIAEHIDIDPADTTPDGAFTADFVLPDDIPAGEHYLMVTSCWGGADDAYPEDGVEPCGMVGLGGGVNDRVAKASITIIDECVQTIEGMGTYSGSWSDDCKSDKRPNDSDEGGEADREYYARFYTFTLDDSAEVTITLRSDSVDDTFLYLLLGEGKDGTVETFNDDIDRSSNNHSRIDGYFLEAGTYTIEATTYRPDTDGSFTLEVDIGEAVEPPIADVKYIAISSGANHVCAIAEGGSIMCWGDDSEGQVSEMPTSGRFTEISSGENHTCALREDGNVICWGSLDLP